MNLITKIRAAARRGGIVDCDGIRSATLAHSLHLRSKRDGDDAKADAYWRAFEFLFRKLDDVAKLQCAAIMLVGGRA